MTENLPMFTAEDVALLENAFLSNCSEHQLNWHADRNQRVRMIPHAGQIDDAAYFAREALIDAILTGRNQIVLSASKAQAHRFKNYMQDFVREVLGTQLTGDPITLWNGAELRFRTTSNMTWAGYHGNVLVDALASLDNFEQVRRCVQGVACNKRYRMTYLVKESADD